MVNLKVYHLIWKKYGWDEFKGAKFLEKKYRGVYQVYGTHSVYGKDVLLYIGKTTDQNFSMRMDTEQHWDFAANHYNEFSHVHLGMLMPIDDANINEFQSIITDIESLLINAHSPAYNASGIKGLKDHDLKNEFIVVNWGNYGLMLPEVSTLKFTNKYWDGKKYTEKVLFE